MARLKSKGIISGPIEKHLLRYQKMYLIYVSVIRADDRNDCRSNDRYESNMREADRQPNWGCVASRIAFEVCDVAV